jgi:hypothetical protein
MTTHKACRQFELTTHQLRSRAQALNRRDVEER